MASTCTLKPSLTDTELDETYGTGTSLLSAISASVGRDANGMLTSSALSSTMTTLKASGAIPSASGKTPISGDALAQQQQAFLTAVKEEYCFYYARYMNALEKLFSAISAAYSQNSTNTQKNVNTYLLKTQTLNQKLNDLTQIINAVAENAMSTATSMSQEIEAYNNKVKELQKKLAEQNAILNSSEATMQLNKQMVKYTEEKARRSDNLLQLYGFLNVVVLGLLVYVYRAAGDE